MTDGSFRLNDTARISRSCDGDDLDLALAPERDRLLPVHDLERLVGGVQEERLLHGLTLHCARHGRACQGKSL